MVGCVAEHYSTAITYSSDDPISTVCTLIALYTEHILRCFPVLLAPMTRVFVCGAHPPGAVSLSLVMPTADLYSVFSSTSGSLPVEQQTSESSHALLCSSPFPNFDKKPKATCNLLVAKVLLIMNIFRSYFTRYCLIFSLGLCDCGPPLPTTSSTHSHTLPLSPLCISPMSS